MAYLDELRARIVWAHRSNNTEAMLALAHEFYERYSWSEKGEPCPSYKCTAARSTMGGFSLSFGDVHLTYSKRGKKWCVCGHPDYLPSAGDSHDVAAHMFSAPFSFLEGIAFCIECVEAAQENGALAIMERHLESKRKELELADLRLSRVLDRYYELKQDVKSMESRLRSPDVVKGNRGKASAAAAGEDYPPPPTTTLSLDAFRAAFSGVSGVYFFWNGDSIDYVGRADCIATRVRPSHEHLEPHHRFSAIPMSIRDTHIKELYYIGRYEPPLNGQVRRGNGHAQEATPVDTDAVGAEA